MSASLHAIRFPNESDGYRAARDELLRAEIDLREKLEAVAALRRRLPDGGAVREDYAFEEIVAGAKRTTRLSDLFGDKSTLESVFDVTPEERENWMPRLAYD